MNPLRELGIAALLIVGLSLPAFGDDSGKEEKPDSDEKKTHTVKAGPFKIEVTLDGVFEAGTTHEVLLRPEVWSSLKVDEVISEGARVDEGETILKLETKDLEEEIRNQEFALRLSELSLKQTRSELDSLEKSVPLDLEAARRSQRIAEEELEYFLDVTEDQRKESARQSLKSAEYSLEYAQEELDQLEQMYKADDLTEETEEIILKRAQRSVERSQYFLDLAETRYTRSMETDIPREKQRVEETAERQKLALRKAEATLPSSLDRQKIELEKQTESHEKLEEKLEKLEDDLELLTVKSPADGIVYYGQADRGKWTTAATIRKQLRPGGSVSANSVIMTIVSTEPGFVRVDIPEKDFRHFDEGVPATVKPTAFPDTEYSGECSARGPVAVKEGTFDGRVEYEWEDGQPKPVPGMTCKVTIVPYRKDKAITVPESAVFGEDDDRHVFVQDGEESRKQSVKTGHTSGNKIEITDGLSDGDVILLEKP